ncbi:hypothetical protein Poly51_11720 [Rubripirellula tenax]|uniref:Uncharacterized protein n=1 Tax=Rubripirellula tenax TaxID=2528015 RepID=A0A5C6FIX3_9BACT|nr:hypothetical protein [Rubripirellula tenax]TWU60890.1 hypothetical protein Poly51_11720 [Rubripirellula tenax]
MVRKHPEKQTESVDDTAYRWIGSFCGAILGVCVAALLLYVAGFDSTLVVIVFVTCGLAAGAIAGYRMPAMSDAILWIASLFT